MEEDLTNYKDKGEDEDNIYGGIDGATLGNEVWQLSHWREFQVYVSWQSEFLLLACSF